MAAEFDGSNDRIELGTWDVTGDKITVCGWVYVHTTPSDPRVISKGDNTSLQQFCLLVNGNDTVGFRIVGPNNTTGDRTILNTSQTLNMNQWYFLAGVYDGSEMRVYIDAIEKNSVAKSGNIAAPGTNVWIGGQATSATSRPFDGLIEDVRVYSRALSDAELTTIYNSEGHDGIVDGLEGRWTLDYGSEGQAISNTLGAMKDVSGNERHGDAHTSSNYAAGILTFRRRIG